MAHRRRGAAAGRERKSRERLARRRRRRVGPDRRSPGARDRRAHQRRPRPPHHLRLARRARGAVRGVARPRAQVVRGESLPPFRGPLGWPASTTAATPRARSRRSSSPACGGCRAGARRAAAQDGAWSAEGSGAASPCWTTTPTIRPSSGRRSTPPASCPRLACSPPSSRTSTAYAPPGAELGAALARADAACVTEIYAAREEPLTGVSGKLVVDAILRGPPGHAARVDAPASDAARFLSRRARAGDLVLHSAPAISTGCPTWCWRRSRDRARRGARPFHEPRDGRARAPRQAADARPAAGRPALGGDEGISTAAVGLGSNLLAADEGVDVLVVKLEGELAGVATDGETLAAGGERTWPSACTGPARPASATSSSPAPSRARRRRGVDERGRVRRGHRRRARAGAGRGGRRGAVLADARGAGSRLPPLGAPAREVVTRAEFRLSRRDPAEIRDGGRHAGPPQGRTADEPTHVRQRVQEPRPRADSRPHARGVRPARLSRWGAQISPRHANFIENAGGATTADALALMEEGPRRARRRFGVELEHEVQLLGNIRLAPVAAG